MIRAVIWTDSSGALRGCETRGHSGYAEAGADIVCAAVSVLCTNCLNSLEALCGVRCAVSGGDDGYLAFRLPEALPRGSGEGAQLLLRSLRQGLADVAEAYPQYVKLSIRKEG